MAESQKSVESPRLEVVDNRCSWVEPAPKAGDLRLPERMQNLGVVLERLWRFYEAMHRGEPLAKSDQVLPQMGSALRSAIKPGDSL